MDDYAACVKHREGKESLQQLVIKHGGLARTWARKYCRQDQCCTEEDLFQEARRGLIDAVEHWQPERGAFSTVASIWIRKRCLAFIQKAKSVGLQSDCMNDHASHEMTSKDYSHLQKHFHVIEKLHQNGWISDQDREAMKVLCAPMDDQDELMKPLIASWWSKQKRGALNRVAKAMREFQERKGTIKQVQRVEIQRRMWA